MSGKDPDLSKKESNSAEFCNLNNTINKVKRKLVKQNCDTYKNGLNFPNIKKHLYSNLKKESNFKREKAMNRQFTG